MKPKTNGNDIRMFVIQPLYEVLTKPLVTNGEKIKDEFGNKVMVEKDKFIREVYLKMWFDKNDVSPYGEYIGSKGKVLKNRSKIYCKSTQNFYTVAHSLRELEDGLQKKNYDNIGFNKDKHDEI